MTMESIAPASPPHRDRSAATSTPPTEPIPVIPRVEFDYDVAIVGLGYVGLPTALALHASGARVLGIDASQARLDAIRAGDADLLEFDRVRLARGAARRAVHDHGRRRPARRGGRDRHLRADARSTSTSHPTSSILRAACATVVERAVAGQLVMLTSTTYVGCTRDLLVDPLAGSRARGRARHPRRVQPRAHRSGQRPVHATRTCPRVVGGATPSLRSRRAAALLGRSAHAVHPVALARGGRDDQAAREHLPRGQHRPRQRVRRHLPRARRSTSMEVIEAAATKPYGFMPFYPGPGVGGHCIPCDPHYLLWQLRAQRIVLAASSSRR